MTDQPPTGWHWRWWCAKCGRYAIAPIPANHRCRSCGAILQRRKETNRDA